MARGRGLPAARTRGRPTGKAAACMSGHPRPSELSTPAAAARLRTLTPARVGLGRTGVSQQARDVLAFQLAHARARDAVHARMDAAALQAAIAGVVTRTHEVPVLRLRSSCPDRATYLQRPDLGRRLDESSREALAHAEG